MDPIRLLLADDSDIMRSVICSLLESQRGVAVIGEARDFPGLLEMLRKSSPDVVLMDVHMPGNNHIDLNKANHLRNACVLVMSLWNDEETEALARCYTKFPLLDKSNLAATLMPAIQECAR
jgi:DNA-binding NarL/FixJ family response regulator